MSDTRINGRVKWFDSNKGYGFVETMGTSEGDLFVHFSNIEVSDEKVYKKLFPGEYISFVKSQDNGENRVECKNVKGVECGPLMTENTEYRFKVFKHYDHSSFVACSPDDTNPDDTNPDDTNPDEN